MFRAKKNKIGLFREDYPTIHKWRFTRQITFTGSKFTANYGRLHIDWVKQTQVKNKIWPITHIFKFNCHKSIFFN